MVFSCITCPYILPLDVDECAPNGIGRNCHFCNNLLGSFECGCNEGFYLSEPAHTCFGEDLYTSFSLEAFLVSCGNGTCTSAK